MNDSRPQLRAPLDSLPAGRQSTAFLGLYALAWAGGAIAYVPLLTILLPVRVAEMTGEQRVHWVAYLTFFAAIAASAGGIVFGWLSDWSGARRPWIVTGLVSTLALMMCVPLAEQPLQLLALIIVWELALNMMLGPLSAWAADLVPSDQLGSLGGLLALAPALGSAAGALVTLPLLRGLDVRLTIIAVLVAIGVLPVLAFGRPRLEQESSPRALPDILPGRTPRVAAAMWLARCLVQISEATLFAYFYYYFRSIDPSRDASWIAQVYGFVLCTSVPIALAIGRWSDRQGRPLFPLISAALVIGVALVAMAGARDWTEATAAYVLFGLATAVFLSLHSAQTLRVLRRPHRRGLDLGIFNLTNTIPSLIMPWLTVAIVPSFGFPRLFLVLASLAFGAAFILLMVGAKALNSKVVLDT